MHLNQRPRPNRYRDRLVAIGQCVRHIMKDPLAWPAAPFILSGAVVVAIKELPGVRQVIQVKRGRKFTS